MLARERSIGGLLSNLTNVGTAKNGIISWRKP
jgi:hypothetical protein